MAATPVMATTALSGLALAPAQTKCGWSSHNHLTLQSWNARCLLPCSDAASSVPRAGSTGKRCAAGSEGSSPPSTGESATGVGEEADADREQVDNGVQQQLRSGRSSARSRTPESTDWIASSLTRRFGLGAGLAWVGFLAFGVISEQIKTRTEVFLEEQGTRDVEDGKEVLLPDGIRYVDLRLGGGSSPQRGDFVLLDISGRVSSSGQQFLDTASGTQRSLAFVFGSRPYANGLCQGVEVVLQNMRAGGKRLAIIPPELGFGEEGAQFGEDGVKIPGGSQLEYVIQLQRVSIAPGYFPYFEELELC